MYAQRAKGKDQLMLSYARHTLQPASQINASNFVSVV